MTVPRLKMVNVTPHVVAVYDESNTFLKSWQPSGTAIRIVELQVEGHLLSTEVGVVPVAIVRYERQLEGLPDPQEGTAYIVSRVTAAAVDRPDLYFPFDEVRDERGQILGCRALGQFDHSATGESGGEDAE